MELNFFTVKGFPFNYQDLARLGGDPLCFKSVAFPKINEELTNQLEKEVWASNQMISASAGIRD